MSHEPMDFENADSEHLDTWHGVCRLIATATGITVIVLLILAMVLL